MTAVRILAPQGSEAWKAVRRTKITASDIPVILGLSPYRSEAHLAAEKLGSGPEQEQTLAMRLGLALEPLIGDEYTRLTGRRLRRFDGMVQHADIEWAAASPDFENLDRAADGPDIVETKWTASRVRFADDLPQDIEAQTRWQLGCGGWRVADVAALVAGESEPRVFTVEHDERTFADLVTVAEDFRRRLAAGGPFGHNLASVKDAYPADDGTEMVADADLAATVYRLQAIREQRSLLEAEEDTLKAAIEACMGTASRLIGPDFTVTWKKSKDSTQVDWKSIADGLLRTFVPETERDALVGLHSAVRTGMRPFRVDMKGSAK